MKKWVLILLFPFCLLWLASGASYAQAPANEIERALGTGNTSAISKYFAASVDITINNTTSTYSKAQAELVLKDFFGKNPVQGFDTKMAGNSNSVAATFTIGELRTKSGEFKVFIWLKPNEKTYTLKAIRFEK